MIDFRELHSLVAELRKLARPCYLDIELNDLGILFQASISDGPLTYHYSENVRWVIVEGTINPPESALKEVVKYLRKELMNQCPEVRTK